MDRKALLLVLALAPLPAQAQRVLAELDCRPAAGPDYAYDCAIRLQRGGAPLAGAQVAVGVDMPSMPMAHNVKPVKALPGKSPGEYRAALALEMRGEWAVTLRLDGVVKDRLILLYDFDEKGAKPVKRPVGRIPR
jgi:hypothetical protein